MWTCIHFTFCLLVGASHVCLTFGGFCTSLKSAHPRCESKFIENTQEKLVCNGGLLKKYQSNSRELWGLVLCHLPGPNFNPTVLSHFPQLHKFVLMNSNITHFVQPFPHLHSLQILNLTRLHLRSLEVNTFGGLNGLKILDLSYNKLAHFGRYLVEFLPNLQQLYLKGIHWKCDHKLRWLTSKKNTSLGRKVVDAAHMICGRELYPRKPVLSIMIFLENLDNDCRKLELCQCTLDNVVWSPEREYLIPLITVNCAKLGLKTMPETMPTNVTTLILTGNEISDLTPLTSNPSYLGVSDVYLDHNNIEDIDILETADWLHNFRVLSLESNKIRTLPTYAFDNAFQRNSHVLNVFFGNNPWICDCHFTPGFKELLLKYNVLIKDIADIRCASQENNDNSMKMIIELPLTAICREPQTILSPIDTLNVILALGIIFTLSKLIYDYYVFKTSGRLPWIVRILP